MDQDLINILNRMKQNCKVEEVQYDCPICEDKGYIFEIQDGYEVATPCKCLPKRQSIEKMNRSGLTEVFKQKTINSFKADKKWQIEAKFKVKQYIEDFLKKGSLFIIGDYDKQYMNIDELIKKYNFENVFKNVYKKL